MTKERLPFGPGVIVLGGGALLLIGVLALGFLLPTDWEADASARLAAEPGAIFAYIDSPEGWRAWTPWPDSGLVREGPDRGVGAMISWDDSELGSGSFRIVEADAPRRVVYAVDVGGGAMSTRGAITVTPDGAGSVVSWHEQGDLGRNPLMGFWAFFMNRAQTTELEKGLAQLSDLVTSH